MRSRSIGLAISINFLTCACFTLRLFCSKRNRFSLNLSCGGMRLLKKLSISSSFSGQRVFFEMSCFLSISCSIFSKRSRISASSRIKSS
uniref:Putative secreted protein n=1 Tax=Anopheles darlingi TaxID=43151 RepID=A0A2M4D6S0_ANODA